MEQILQIVLNFLETNFGALVDFIILPYLITFTLLAYFVKKNFGAFLSKITNAKWKPVYTVLVLATLVGIPFIAFSEYTWQQVIVTYAIGTSCYEVIAEYFIKRYKPGTNEPQ